MLFGSCVADVCSSSVFILFSLCYRVAHLTPAGVGGVSSFSFGYLRSIHLKLIRYSKPLWHLPALVMFSTFYHSHSLQKLMRRQPGRFPDANRAFFSLFLEKGASKIAVTMGHRPPSLSNLLGGHTKVIGENEFSRHKTFITQTELGHLDGILPRARLHWWWHKSQCYQAIKKCQLSRWGHSGYELFSSLFCYANTTF